MTREEKINAQKKEISSFINYFSNNKLDVNNDQTLARMEAGITRVIKLELEELGYSVNPGSSVDNAFELEFTNDPSNNIRGEQVQPKKVQGNNVTLLTPRITLNIANIYKGLDNDDPELRLHACKRIFTTIFHEIQHHRQEMMAQKNYSSKEALTYGRDLALMQALERDFYNVNYKAFALENNANETSYRQYQSIMGYDKREEEWRIFEEGRLNTGRYTASGIMSNDGKDEYNLKLDERDDVSTAILDDVICKKGKTNILCVYPILQKEYNLDGTKKSALDLIKNLKAEQDSIGNNTFLSDEERKTALKDSQEMYYELIYRALENSTPEQFAEISEQLGKSESKEFFDKMKYYFQTQMEHRIAKATKMASVTEKNDKEVLPSNKGTIMIEKDGQKVPATIDEFIATLDPEALKKTFIHPVKKTEHSAETFLRKVGFRYLDQTGEMTLKDGTTISAKDYVEQYMLGQLDKFTESYTVKDLITETVQPEKQGWVVQRQTRERLVNYYGNKMHFLSNVSDMITEDKQQTPETPTLENPPDIEVKKDDATQQKKLTPEQLSNKMKWIKELIDNYDLTESEQQYTSRTLDEDANTLQVLKGIEDGEFKGEGLSKIDLNYFPNDKEFNIARAIPKIVRLLKAAYNITIEGGRNYLEEFANIPNVNEILVQIKKSESVKKLAEEAQENKKTGNIPNYKKTRAEKDKKLAQDYLKSGKLSQPTIEEELAYRADTLRGADEVVVDFDAKTTSEIPLERRQKTALTRIIARQQGKIPSQVVQKNGIFVFEVDTQKSKTIQTGTQEIESDSISPSTITDSTIRTDITRNEINSVVNEIRRTQTRDLQQTQQK